MAGPGASCRRSGARPTGSPASASRCRRRCIPVSAEAAAHARAGRSLAWLVPAAAAAGGRGWIAIRVRRRPRPAATPASRRPPASPARRRLASLLLLLAIDCWPLLEGAPGQVVLGNWFASGDCRGRLSLHPGRAVACRSATLVALIAGSPLRFLGQLPAPRGRLPPLFHRAEPVPRRHAADRPRRQRGADLRRLGAGRRQLLPADRLRLGPSRRRPATRCSPSSPTASAMPASCSASAWRCLARQARVAGILAGTAAARPL